VSLAGDTTPFASFAPPAVAGGAALTFHLDVDDGLATSGDDITITVPDLRDQDGDGDPFCSDCNDLDATQSSPAPVAGFVVDRDRRTLRWSASPSTTFDLYRGTIAGHFAYTHTCLVTVIIGQQFSDSAQPPAGQAFYYLVRADNACGKGLLGMASRGSSVPVPACP